MSADVACTAAAAAGEATAAAPTGDCDKTQSTINPSTAEICDASDTDEDCEGAADDADADATVKTANYVDSDGDGFGLAASRGGRADETAPRRASFLEWARDPWWP